MKNDLPQGWSYRPLGDIASINMGQSPESSFYNRLGEGLPLIQGNTDCQNRKTVAKTFSSQITKKAFDGDIILSVRAPVGTIAICSQDSCIGRGVCAVRGKDVDHEYLKQYLIFIESRWNQFGQGSTFTAINSSDIKKFSIAVPKDKKIQNRISKILSTWDRTIEALGKLIEAKTRRFLWLIHTSTTAPSKKQGWNQTCIGEIGNIIKGKGITKEDLTEKGVPCIRYADLYTKYDFVVREINSYVSTSAADLAQFLKKGDIIFAGSGETAEDIGKCAAYLAEHRQAVVGGDTLILRQKNCDSNYLAYALNSPRVNKQKSTLGHGHSVVHLYGKDLKKVRLSLPSQNQQKKIASMLNAAKTEIDLLKELSEHCVEQKRGLMQKLLTGKIRVTI